MNVKNKPRWETSAWKNVPTRSGAIAAMSTGLFMAIVAMASMSIARHNPGDILGDAAALVFITSLIAMVVSLRLYRYGRKLWSLSQKPDPADNRSSVLYLRSFQSDRDSRKSAANAFTLGNTMTEMEEVAGAFRPIGPLLMVKRPDQRLPELGARWVELPSDDWELDVERLVEGAKLVLVRIGSTAGLQEEIRMCLERVSPDRLILLLPGREGLPVYDEFRVRYGSSFRHSLPDYVPDWPTSRTAGALVWFTPDWYPKLAPIKRRRAWRRMEPPLAVPFALALEGYARFYGIRTRSDAAPLRRIGAVLLDTLLFLSLAAGATAVFGDESLIILAPIFLMGISAFEASALQGTPGKWLMGVRVVGRGGTPLVQMQVLVRLMAKFFSAASVILALISLCLIVLGRSALHDMITRTRVERRIWQTDASGSSPSVAGTPEVAVEA